MAGHFFLSAPGMIVLYGLLGVCLAIWLRFERLLLLTVLLAELLAGLLFWLFGWDRGQFAALAENMQVSPVLLGAMTIGLNMLTAYLVTWCTFYFTKMLLPYIYTDRRAKFGKKERIL